MDENMQVHSKPSLARSHVHSLCFTMWAHHCFRKSIYYPISSYWQTLTHFLSQWICLSTFHINGIIQHVCVCVCSTLLLFIDITVLKFLFQTLIFPVLGLLMLPSWPSFLSIFVVILNGLFYLHEIHPHK